MTYQKVRIEAAPMGNGSRVFIDGIEQTDLVAIDVKLRVNDVPTLTLTHIGVEFVIEGEMQVLHAKKCPACGDVSEPTADVTVIGDGWRKYAPLEPQ